MVSVHKASSFVRLCASIGFGLSVGFFFSLSFQPKGTGHLLRLGNMTAARSKGHSGAVAPGDPAQQGQTAGLHEVEGPGGLPGALQSPGCGWAES